MTRAENVEKACDFGFKINALKNNMLFDEKQF